MHKEENIGQVELATISFGQSFQVTPIQTYAFFPDPSATTLSKSICIVSDVSLETIRSP